MATRTVSVAARVGLHARPAALIAQAARSLDVAVTLARPGGRPVDAGSVVMIMTLGAECGDMVEVSSADPAAADAIAALVEQELDG